RGMAEVQRGNDKTVARKRLVETLGARQVPAVPGAAMEIDDRRERPITLGFVEACSQRLVAMAQIPDGFGREFIRLGRHIHSPSGLLCGGASETGTAAFTLREPTAHPTRSRQPGKDAKLNRMKSQPNKAHPRGISAPTRQQLWVCLPPSRPGDPAR